MRLIDGDALKERYESHRNLYCKNRIEFKLLSEKDKARVDELDNCIADILNAPTIEERKKGKWIDEGFYADGHGAHALRCSECGGHIIEYDADPFCKWCGADMRGKKE